MLIYYLILINFFSLFVMLIDKKLAIKGKQRISEKFIYICAFIFGSIGILFGMHLFKHKTKKTKFSVGIPVLLLLQIILSFYLYNTIIR